MLRGGRISAIFREKRIIDILVPQGVVAPLHFAIHDPRILSVAVHVVNLITAELLGFTAHAYKKKPRLAYFG